MAARASVVDRRPSRRDRIQFLSRGLPVPPPSLRTKVVRNADALNFLTSGRNHYEFITAMLERNGVAPGDSVLDFGCGCGRVLRWWWLNGFEPELCGSDINPDLIDWCRHNLPFVEAAVNDELPPLAFADDRFDLIYTISIFTHLPEARQRPWMEELMRAIKPGGHLLFTVAGSAYAETLSAEDRRRYDDGALVVHFDEQPGSNLCAVYHPREYVERLISGFELIDAFSGDPEQNMRQDAYLLRKPLS